MCCFHSAIRILAIRNRRCPNCPKSKRSSATCGPLLTGRTVTGVRQSKQKLRRPWRAKWNAAVTGSRIEGLRRRGKWILINLTPPAPLPFEGRGELKAPLSLGEGLGRGSPVLRIHLGMTGQFTVVPATEPEPDHLHVVFALDNATELRFRDPRRFGSAEYFADRTRARCAR